MELVGRDKLEQSFNSNTITAPLPEHKTGDLLLVIVGKQSNSGTATGPAGWSEVDRSSYNNTGTGCDLHIYYKIAASDSEPDPTYSNTDSDPLLAQTYSIRGVDQTTPIEAGAGGELDGSKTEWVMESVTTLTDGAAVFYTCMARNGWVLPGPTMNMGGLAQVSATFNAVAFIPTGAAGLSPAPVFRGSSGGEGQWHTFAIRPAVARETLPGSLFDAAADIINTAVNANTVGVTYSDPSVIAPTIDGLPVAFDAPGSQGQSHRIIGTTATRIDGQNLSNHRGSYMELDAPVDLSSLFFICEFSPRATIQLSRLATVAQRGVTIAPTDGVNWAAMQVHARDQADDPYAWSAKVIDAGQLGTAYDSDGTPDVSAITGFLLLIHGDAECVFGPYYFAPKVWTLIGGSASAPIKTRKIADAFGTNLIDSQTVQGEEQSRFSVGLQVGDGSSLTVCDFDQASWEFMRRYDEEEKRLSLHAADSTIGVRYLGVAGDTIKHRHSLVYCPSPAFWEIDAASTDAATWDFAGLNIIGASPVILRPVTVFACMSFDRCGQIQAQGCELFKCMIAGALDASAMVIDTATKLSACDFMAEAASEFAIEIPAAGTYELDAVTFTGYTTDLDVTAASGTVTVIVKGGGTIPTFQTAGATVVVLTQVPIEVTVVDKNFDPIEDATVLIREAGDGPIILQDVTGPSGVVSGTYQGPTPQPVEGAVVKITGSPVYRIFHLGGEITSEGYVLTAVMQQECAELIAIEDMVRELWQLQGLDIAHPMTVTPTSRTVDAIDLDISGDGETISTVTRQP